ncbi:unnamed protein product, partial [Brassica rapa subsp. narinosa]
FNKIGDGRNTRVWLDNWLLDSTPRPPMYRQDAVVDLTLSVNDLIDRHTSSWNADLVRQLIAEVDVDLVLNTKIVQSRDDSFVKEFCSQKQNIGVLLRLSFPWLLWHIWKARNKFCFEQVQPIALEVVRKAREEATVWLNLHGYLPECLNTSAIDPESTEVWSKPQGLSLKCSIGASWNGSSSVSGASWIIWNSRGKV